MLKRIYIDNFRGLVNFEMNFDSINLFLGGNGSGKSTVFEALRRIQLFISGVAKVEVIFPFFDCTRWQTLPIQRFEIEIDGNNGNYKYELAIEHNRENSQVKYERLWYDNQPLLKFDMGEVQIFYDNHLVSPTKYPPFNWSESILPLFMANNDITKLTWFKQRMERFIIVQIIPSMIINGSQKEEVQLSPKMENFISWYRYISHDQGKVAELINVLKNVLDGFISFKFDQFGVGYTTLQLRFASVVNPTNIYYFNELSDGQKVLIALYTLIYCTQSEDYTLCIDEPENFLALPEIQPWIIKLYDLCSDRKIQALLISHHPVLINYLLASPIGYWFERRSNAPVRVKPISNEETENSGLPISELIARGWLYDPE
ncbi:AAA family ATPase [Nostoc sp.]